MEKINRAVLKENGKIALKRNFWMIMAIVLVGSFCQVSWTGLNGSGGIGFNFVSSVASDDTAQVQALMEQEDLTLEEAAENIVNGACAEFGITKEEFFGGILIFIGIFLLVFVLIYVIATVIQFTIGSFVYAPIGVGYRRYFMKNRHGIQKFGDVFSAFEQKKYMSIVKAMFTTNIRIWGWSMLFYFPGLVKFYEYYFVPYIVAENPNISGERAREISQKMTDGHKWQIFVLGLSFLGWIMLFFLIEIVLALVSCGLLAIPGFALIFPIAGYEAVTYAELYAERREYAVRAGIANREELKGFEEVKEEIL